MTQGSTFNRTWAFGLLALAFLLFYLAPLPFHGLWIPDETRYAQASQEMLLTGHWATPHFMGLRYFEKPAAGYWMIAIGQAVFGQNLFGVRVASAVALALSVVLAWLIAGRFWRNPQLQLTSAVVYMSLSLICAGSGYANLDPQFTLWVNLSIFALWYAVDAATTQARLGAWAGVGFACALGFMTKGFLALLLPVLVALPYMFWQRRFLELVRYGLVAVVVAVLLSLPWALTVNHQEPDFWNYFFWDEHIRRFAGDDAQHAESWYYYLPIMLMASLPWVGLLPDTLVQGWKDRVQPHIAFLWLWLLLPLVFFSIAKGKLPSYIMPCLLPLALLMGQALVRRLEQGRLAPLRLNSWLNVAMGVVALLAVAYLQMKKPIYHHEPKSLALLVLALLGWTMANLLAVRKPARWWMAPAVGMGIALALIPAALPRKVVDNKTPDTFIAQHTAELKNTPVLMSNELGAASALSWHTGNSQIILYNTGGETRYGLAYPDAQGRAVTKEEVGPWLAAARRKSSVGVVMRVKGEDEQAELDELPAASRRYEAGSIVILIYDQTSP
ncbi:lipid IV(A) 4-amino-4-deoxy-L-arabinosyltransferase [Pseudomonas sp. dw_358]|uniref:lipid IV(A) 4-amino-4-deoxy-L-arabinosyltransferase n=1 Tax=Pseudomonas sp. dw_358 TaxID=2720083 RepID=UPI001BD4668D|nr:lipid IV(A) 4-amino-4-deoxy-L-arabinosyltransferase [Pseudomonas sp. dw_358]